jgi:hypothetical protein
MRAAAAIWFLFAAVLLLVFLRELSEDRGPGVLLMVGLFSLTSAWLGGQLWRAPSLPVVIISMCVAAFIVFLWLVVLVEGRIGSPWALIVPLLAGSAALLALMSRATAR